MAHEWSYSKSNIKDQPQQTKALYAFKIPDQLACPLELKTIQQPEKPNWLSCNKAVYLSLQIAHYYEYC